MYLLFEESGDIRAATVLSQQGEAWQAENTSGKRVKIRQKDVLLQFARPTAEEVLEQAHVLSQDVDPSFLWECVPEDEEFSFITQASEYFGADAGVVEQVALLMALQAAPIYFRRKGRGLFMRAPVEHIQAALAGLERKKQQAAQQAEYEAELKAHRLPAVFVGKVMNLLFKPDKNSLEWKALDAACTALSLTPTALMVACGGIASPFALHENRFSHEFFPKGIEFPPVEVPAVGQVLPVAAVQAFSIDDSKTTEIDDAFSVTPDGPDRWKIGIHIAAPGLAMVPGSPLDAIARQRLSTVYMPGNKITMLPDAVVEAYTLQEGRTCPALSLYLTVDTQHWTITGTETRAESVPMAANLRHDRLDDVITDANLGSGSGEYPFKTELMILWPFAQALHAQRQEVRISNGLRPEHNNRADYSFSIEKQDNGEEKIIITPRKRGSPLDLIVAELMILANSTWGKLLADAGVPGVYRTQRAFGVVRTRMQTTPAPHQGLGVEQYVWSTSPLRRYADLINQWQILAVAQHGVTAKLVAPFKPKQSDLLAIVADFDATYSGYATHQAQMERYWCLRWLQQENKVRVQAATLKEGAVRLSEIPLVLNVPELANQPRGTWVVLDVMSIDLIGLTASCRVAEILPERLDDALFGDDLLESFSESSSPAPENAEDSPANENEEADSTVIVSSEQVAS